ncbi:hypothetical protein BKA91DRAFT_135652 [Yarrowia lipolytica]|nr:hypothetical protein BKA91DRAFT_135652 [Yarrowia lipolytica]KAE8173635.1 hypothetical protein BKA90DRAFT_135285 [Yarrowia lipolytica]RMI97799.1 hypothetical protein BD777DRAFT_126664 [Yarrowia lipolytica]
MRLDVTTMCCGHVAICVTWWFVSRGGLCHVVVCVTWWFVPRDRYGPYTLSSYGACTRTCTISDTTPPWQCTLSCLHICCCLLGVWKKLEKLGRKC